MGKDIFNKIADLYQILVAVFTVALFIIATITIVSSLRLPGGLRIFVVKTGSMTPTIAAGSLIFVKPAANYQEKDIITFRTTTGEQKEDQLVTHRLHSIVQTSVGDRYITKGDFNESVDPNQISPDLVIGKTYFHLPFLGFIIAFSKTPIGLISIIVIPATVIIYSELITIKSEIVRLWLARRQNERSTSS